MAPVTLLASGSPLLPSVSKRAHAVCFLSTIVLLAVAVPDWHKRSSQASQGPSGLGSHARCYVFPHGAVSSPSDSAHRRSTVALARTRSRRTHHPVSDQSQFTALHRAWSALPVVVSPLHLVRHGCTHCPRRPSPVLCSLVSLPVRIGPDLHSWPRHCLETPSPTARRFGGGSLTTAKHSEPAFTPQAKPRHRTAKWYIEKLCWDL